MLGTQRVAAFKVTRKGTFSVKFAVPGGRSGRLRIVARQTIRGLHGSGPALRLRDLRYRVVAPGGAGGKTTNGPASPTGSGGSGGITSAPTGVAGSGGSGSGSGGSGGSTGGLSAGTGSSSGGAGAPVHSGGGSTTGSWWIPPQHLTWYLQLQGTIDNGEPVDAYDVDGFETSVAEVWTLHALNLRTICYVDVGTYEPYRPDANKFPGEVLGSELEGWPGERWLNIGDLSALEPIMTARLQMCKEKGFDAVDPDNMDGFENKTGFPLTAAEQLTYDEWVASEAHSLGMAVFQKNDGEQTPQLASHFDGEINEECNVYKECSDFRPYLAAGKPVLDAEYGLRTSQFCAADDAAGIMGARYDVALDGSLFEPCW